MQDCDCAGGRFNRSAVVEFESSGEVLTISQTFTGQDVQGHMRISTHLDGHLPDIAEDAQVEVDDYYEEYRRISPGTSAAHRASRGNFTCQSDCSRCPAVRLRGRK